MERKEIVKRLSEHLGVKSKYLGPPNFEYEIKTEDETYIIDRYGVITTREGRRMTLDEILNPSESAVEEPEEVEVIANEEETLPFDGLELKLPLGNHTGRTLQNLINMISSKQHLIMMAFETTDEKISAFQHLMALINESARKLMRASFKPSQDDNPKYAFRTWLIRLGMNGKEYKAIRKTLLSNLEGSGAFRKVPEDREEEING